MQSMNLAHECPRWLSALNLVFLNKVRPRMIPLERNWQSLVFLSIHPPTCLVLLMRLQPNMMNMFMIMLVWIIVREKFLQTRSCNLAVWNFRIPWITMNALPKGPLARIIILVIGATFLCRFWNISWIFGRLIMMRLISDNVMVQKSYHPRKPFTRFWAAAHVVLRWITRSILALPNSVARVKIMRGRAVVPYSPWAGCLRDAPYVIVRPTSGRTALACSPALNAIFWVISQNDAIPKKLPVYFGVKRSWNGKRLKPQIPIRSPMPHHVDANLTYLSVK